MTAGWDFFVSYTGADRPWAEWIAWQLEEAGYRVIIQAWDFVPGSHWMTRMGDGMQKAERTIAVLSQRYLQSVFGAAEWQSAVQADPTGFERKLIPVRIDDCTPTGLLGSVVWVDLVGLGEHAARQTLLDMIRNSLSGRAKPATAPPFPVAAAPTPGSSGLIPPTEQHRPSAPVYPRPPSDGDRDAPASPERPSEPQSSGVGGLPDGTAGEHATRSAIPGAVADNISTHFERSREAALTFVERAIKMAGVEPRLAAGNARYVRLQVPGVRPTICYMNTSGITQFKMSGHHVPASVARAVVRPHRDGFDVNYPLLSMRDVPEALRLLSIAIRIHGGTVQSAELVPPQIARYVQRHFPRTAQAVLAFVERSINDVGAVPQSSRGSTPYIRLHVPGIRPALCYVNPSGRMDVKLSREHVPGKITGVEIQSDQPSGFDVRYYLTSAADVDDAITLLDISARVQRGTPTT